MTVDVSPDDQALVFDLLGDLYLLPIEGGDAISLTSGRAWDQAPRFSPNGEFVYFVSDRDGFKNVWRLGLADQAVHQVTQFDADVMGTPNWSQRGDRLVVGIGDTDLSIGNSEVVLHTVDPEAGTTMPLEKRNGPWLDVPTFTPLRRRIEVFSGVLTTNNQLYFSYARYGKANHGEEEGRTLASLYRLDLEEQKRVAITARGAPYNDYKPQLSHNGKLLAYFRQYLDRRTEVRIRRLASGNDDSVAELSGADDASYNSGNDSRPNYAFTSDDRELLFWHGGKIHRLDLLSGRSQIVPFRVRVEREIWARAKAERQNIESSPEASTIRWPSLTSSGRIMAFEAIGYIWIMDLTTGRIRRLTDSDDFEYMPAISPNGESIAYIAFAQSEKGYSSGRLMVADVKSGMRRDILNAPKETYLLPKWSPDNSMIAAIREVSTESGPEAAFGWTSVEHAEFHDLVPAPPSNTYSSWHIYSRYVRFDDTGENLLLTFPRTRREIAVVIANIDGRSSRTIGVGATDVRGIVPAPDQSKLALIVEDGSVWIVPFPTGSKQAVVSPAAENSCQIVDSGYYVEWYHPRKLTFSFGQRVFSYELDERKLQSHRVALTFEVPKAVRPTAFTGARLITMAEDNGSMSLIESGTIVVDGQRIAAVGPSDEVSIPDEALILDMEGKTIIPGLIDSHYHRIGGRSLSAFALPNPGFSDRSAIKYGVTTAWEPSGPLDDAAPMLADLQRAGRILGPRWSHSGMGAVGYPWEQLEAYPHALAAAKQRQQLGVAVLKEYDTPRRDQRQWLSRAAHSLGLGMVSHIVTYDGMMTRIVDGYTGGDHPYIPVPFFKDVAELLTQTGYVWTPNIDITTGSAGSGVRKRSHYCLALEQARKQNKLSLDDSVCHAEQKISVEHYNHHRLSAVAEQAVSAARYGARIGVSAHSMPASKLHREMWYLWHAGMPVQEVLRMTTLGNAEKLGLDEEVGSLETGKVADFLILRNNPLENILHTLSMDYTVQGGAIYDSDGAHLSE